MAPYRTFIGLLAIALCCITNAADSAVTAGYKLNFEAGVSPDGDNDTKWESTTATTSLDWTFGSAQTPIAVADWDRPNIDKAYVFPAAAATVGSYGTSSAMDNTNDVTIELWVKPNDLNDKHVLFETGGDGAGFSIILDGSQLTATAQSATTNRAIATRSIHGGQTRGLIQVLAVLDVDNSAGDDGSGKGQVDVYLNGVLAATAISPSSKIGSWAGGNASGLGRNNDSVAGGSTGFSNLNGQIAVHRVYENTKLSSDQVFDNFAALSALTQQDLYASWDATSETTATDDPWNAHFQATSNFNWDPAGSAQPTVDTLTPSARPGIVAAYDFNATTLTNSRMNGPANDGSGLGINDGDFSIELWVKPDDLSGKELIWEGGGASNGASLRLDEDTLYFRMRNGGVTLETSTTLTLDHLVDFAQIVGTIDLAGDDIALYVNGLLAGTDQGMGNISVWAGGDTTGLGGMNGGTVGGDSADNGIIEANFIGFDGQIGIARYYTDDLTSTEVRNNFFAVAVVPEPSTLAMLLGLGGFALLGYLRRRRRS